MIINVLVIDAEHWTDWFICSSDKEMKSNEALCLVSKKLFRGHLCRFFVMSLKKWLNKSDY